MMIRLDGCVKCHEGSFKYMRGCQLCASQTVVQFKGTDVDLALLYQKARKDIDAYLSGQPVEEDDPTESASRKSRRLMASNRTVAIIGAGPAGLAAAHDLVQAGHRVTIYEAAAEVGGLAAGFKAAGWDWSLEKYYHHWFASDRHILGLIRELGWSDRVLFPRPYTVIYWQGKFYPFDSIFTTIPAFLLRHFPLIDVIRYGLAGIYLRFSNNWRPLEKVTADAWTRKWFGRRVYDLQLRPLLVSKFGEENARIVNMAWLWARLHSRTTRLGTFVGGFQAFMDQFADLLRARGVEIRLGTAVTGIRRDDLGLTSQPDATSLLKQTEGAGQLVVETASGAESYDAIISTSSPALMAKLAPDLPEAYTASLKALKSMGAVVLVLSLKQQLTQYYWHSLPKEAGFPFLALVEHTNFLPASTTAAITSSTAATIWSRVTTISDSQGRVAGAVHPGPQAVQPGLRRELGERYLAVEDPLCSARAAGQPLAKHPGAAHARARPLLRQHEPGLSVGSRHEFRGGDRAAGGAPGDGGFGVSLLRTSYCVSTPHHERFRCIHGMRTTHYVTRSVHDSFQSSLET